MKIFLLIPLVALLTLSPAAHAKSAKRTPKQDVQWTLKDTVSAALNYSPTLKARQEAVNVAREGVNQAKAGHLPKVDVQGQTGFGSLPVSKYD